MRQPIFLLSWLLCLIAWQFTASGQVLAQAESYDGLVKGALSAYDAGRFVEARTQFKRAHALSPSARTLRGMGMCSFNLGDYVDSMLNLEAALDDASRPLNAEQRAAADELVDRAARKIGRFRLSVVPEDALVTVDGQAAVRSVRGDILVEPGRHELTIGAPGYRSAQRVLSVDPGDRAALEVRLEEGAPESAPTVLPGVETRPRDVAPASQEPARPALPSRLPARRFGIAAVTLGAAGIALFAVAGSMALETRGDLKTACSGSACPPLKHDDVDAYERQKVLASVGVYAGSALALAGVATLWWRARSLEPKAARIEPVIGLGYAGVRGSL